MGQPLEHLGPVLFESARDPLFLLEPESERLVDGNPAALAATALDKASLATVPVRELFRAEDGAALPEGFFRTALTSGTPFSRRMLLRGRHADDWLPVQLDATAFPADGRS